MKSAAARCAVAGRCEDRALQVCLEHVQPVTVGDVGGAVLARLKRQIQIGTEERGAKFSHEFFDCVTFGPETLRAEVARQAPIRVRRSSSRRRGRSRRAAARCCRSRVGIGSRAARCARRFADAGIRVGPIPERAPNRMPTPSALSGRSRNSVSIGSFPSGSDTSGHALTEFVEHYHRERNHQGLDNRTHRGPAADRDNGPRAVSPAARWRAA